MSLRLASSSASLSLSESVSNTEKALDAERGVEPVPFGDVADALDRDHGDALPEHVEAAGPEQLGQRQGLGPPLHQDAAPREEAADDPPETTRRRTLGVLWW
jgi:hypothetical protein